MPDGKGLLFFETTLYNGLFEVLGSIASFYADDLFQSMRCIKSVLDNPRTEFKHKAVCIANMFFLKSHIEAQSKRSKSLLTSLMDTLYRLFREAPSHEHSVTSKMYATWQMLEQLFVGTLHQPVSFEPKTSVRRRQHPRIICTITTCKRYDLFIKTMRSLFATWLDAHMVDDWVIIDDNSSREDVDKMRKEFRWMRFISKTFEQRGHRSSMNIIFDELDRLKPAYWIHLEDDFLFHRRLNYV
jgi:hypothetical protein